MSASSWRSGAIIALAPDLSKSAARAGADIEYFYCLIPFFLTIFTLSNGPQPVFGLYLPDNKE